jgi:hypothetical protein
VVIDRAFTVDILNLSDMLRVTEVERETCHRRTLRFLNLGDLELQQFVLHTMAGVWVGRVPTTIAT